MGKPKDADVISEIPLVISWLYILAPAISGDRFARDNRRKEKRPVMAASMRDILEDLLNFGILLLLLVR